MKKPRFSETKIFQILKEAESGVPVPELCRKHGMSSASFYSWRSKYGGLQVSDVKRLKELEDENRSGPALLEPLVQYDGSGTSNKHYLVADERGSVIAVTNTSGSVTDVNKYDLYGVPASGNDGLFQYTGQMWLDDVDLYHYKARTYDPKLGRFLQTDSIGMAGGINLYAYAGNDAVSFSDPSGLCAGVTQIINRGATIGYGDGGMEEVVATIRAECIEFDEFFPDDESLVNYVNELVRMATSAGATPGPHGKPTACPSVPTAPPGVDVRNNNYGSTGNAMGVPDQVLLRVAGGASIVAGTSPPNSSNPLWRAPYGDNPVDQAWIKKGFEYSRCSSGTGP